MKLGFMITVTFSSQKPTSGTVALGIFQNAPLQADALVSSEDVNFIQDIIEQGVFTGKQGQTLVLYTRSFRPLVLFGLGKKDASKDNLSSQMLDVGGKLAACLESLKVQNVTVVCPELATDLLTDIAEGMALRAWRFSAYKKSNAVPLTHATFYTTDPDTLTAQFQTRAGVVESILWARTLVNEPGNALTPAVYIERIKELSALGLEISALDKKEMEALGMGALMGVAQGSENPPFLGIVQWKGGGNTAPVAFVGKGVTFDSGGLSLKPSRGMEEMKGDMGGSAVVLAVMRALAHTKAPVNAVGVVALVDSPSTCSSRDRRAAAHGSCSRCSVRNAA